MNSIANFSSTPIRSIWQKLCAGFSRIGGRGFGEITPEFLIGLQLCWMPRLPVSDFLPAALPPMWYGVVIKRSSCLKTWECGGEGTGDSYRSSPTSPPHEDDFGARSVGDVRWTAGISDCYMHSAVAWQRGRTAACRHMTTNHFTPFILTMSCSVLNSEANCLWWDSITPYGYGIFINEILKFSVWIKNAYLWTRFEMQTPYIFADKKGQPKGLLTLLIMVGRKMFIETC